MTINSHFISRSQTRPWERDPKKRDLVYYDFTTGEIAEGPSRNLFAIEGLHDETTEALLSKLMETDFGRFKSKLVPGVNPDCDWNTYRSLALRVLLQGPRVGAAAGDETDRQALDALLRLPDGELSMIVIRALWNYEPRLFRANDCDHLLFPDNGGVLVPIANPDAKGGIDVGYGAAIDPKTMLVFMPVASRRVGDPSIPNALTMVSVGVVGNRVLVPPSLLALHSRDELRILIPQWRREMVATISVIKMHNPDAGALPSLPLEREDFEQSLERSKFSMAGR